MGKEKGLLSGTLNPFDRDTRYIDHELRAARIAQERSQEVHVSAQNNTGIMPLEEVEVGGVQVKLNWIQHPALAAAAATAAAKAKQEEEKAVAAIAKAKEEKEKAVAAIAKAKEEKDKAAAAASAAVSAAVAAAEAAASATTKAKQEEEKAVAAITKAKEEKEKAAAAAAKAKQEEEAVSDSASAKRISEKLLQCMMSEHSNRHKDVFKVLMDLDEDTLELVLEFLSREQGKPHYVCVFFAEIGWCRQGPNCSHLHTHDPNVQMKAARREMEIRQLGSWVRVILLKKKNTLVGRPRAESLYGDVATDTNATVIGGSSSSSNRHQNRYTTYPSRESEHHSRRRSDRHSHSGSERYSHRLNVVRLPLTKEKLDTDMEDL